MSWGRVWGYPWADFRGVLWKLHRWVLLSLGVHKFHCFIVRPWQVQSEWVLPMRQLFWWPVRVYCWPLKPQLHGPVSCRAVWRPRGSVQFMHRVMLRWVRLSTWQQQRHCCLVWPRPVLHCGVRVVRAVPSWQIRCHQWVDQCLVLWQLFRWLLLRRRVCVLHGSPLPARFL